MVMLSKIGPVSRWWFYVDYVSGRFLVDSMRDWVGQLGESGEYCVGRVRDVFFHIQSSEVGNPRLC
jgi:hypothetical protein